MKEGWICPKCGRVWSPDIWGCQDCNKTPTGQVKRRSRTNIILYETARMEMVIHAQYVDSTHIIYLLLVKGEMSLNTNSPKSETAMPHDQLAQWCAFRKKCQKFTNKKTYTRKQKHRNRTEDNET